MVEKILLTEPSEDGSQRDFHMGALGFGSVSFHESANGTVGFITTDMDVIFAPRRFEGKPTDLAEDVKQLETIIRQAAEVVNRITDRE
jgi:hypothetical protein